MNMVDAIPLILTIGIFTWESILREGVQTFKFFD